jgi:hypothetical protein
LSVGCDCLVSGVAALVERDEAGDQREYQYRGGACQSGA